MRWLCKTTFQESLDDVTVNNSTRSCFSHSFMEIVGLTSITPGWPNDRALGVQLPHSLSDPRTSPLRSSRRGGKNVQFGNRRRPSPEWSCPPIGRRRGDVRRSSLTVSPAKNHLLREAIRSLAETSLPSRIWFRCRSTGLAMKLFCRRTPDVNDRGRARASEKFREADNSF